MATAVIERPSDKQFWTMAKSWYNRTRTAARAASMTTWEQLSNATRDEYRRRTEANWAQGQVFS